MGQFQQSVAVVGVGCRLPGGITDLDGLWTALQGGRDLVGEMPPDRFLKDRFVDPHGPRPGRSYTAAGGFLTDVASFDAAYFGISPKEAKHLDPQQRLLLEMTAEALDDAAIPAEELAGSNTCVYVGVSDPSYGVILATMENHTSPYTMPGSTLSIGANRLSYAFDLRGPSMVIDTACSSALVALDRACRTLQEGTSRVALAGGVNVLINAYSFAGFSYAGMLSRRGRCAAFSADADGFVRAEGGAVLVLKRLTDAVADGDRVHAVLAATGSNTDGRTTGMTLPSSEAQEALLRTIYQEAGIGPDELVYFEAHGTGTPVGDPAEAHAIGRALGQRRSSPLPIGSVKSNLGHLEPASGMAGLLKAILVLRHRIAPASLHALPLNPAIDFDGLGLAPTVEPVQLPSRGPAAVGVNSFGFGGANAHTIVIPPPTPSRPQPKTAPEQGDGAMPVVVSARSPRALKQLAGRMANRLREADPREYYDLAYTSTVRRSAHPHRAAVLATDPQQAAEELDRLFAGEPARGAVTHKNERGAVAFVYSGNGSQWPGMAADLLASEPVFHSAVEAADAALTPLLGWSVAMELEQPAPERWRRAETAQPALFTVQVGLTALLASHGLRPRTVLGHSVGEVAAAHAAGALTLEQAALVIAERSRTQEVTAGQGRMAAVGLPEQDARQALLRYKGALEIAGINSDRDVTVAGAADALTALGAELESRGVFFRELDLDYAFHSRAMNIVQEPLRAALAGLRPTAGRLPFVSTVTGAPLIGEKLDADYWWRNVREPVRFAQALGHMAAKGVDILVEIGPHPVLRPYLRRTEATCIPTLHRNGDGPREAATAVASLLAACAERNEQAHFPRPGRVVDLPAYPWQHERHWHGTPQDLVMRTSGSGLVEHPLLGERLPAPHPLWHGAVEPQLVPWLGDHRIGGSVLMPAAAYVDMALAAGKSALDRPVEVRYLEISRALALPWPDPGPIALQTAVTPADGALTISTREEHGGDCLPVVRAQLRTLLGSAPAPLDTTAISARCSHTVSGPDYYQQCHRLGLECGPAFQLLHTLHVGEGELLATYRLQHPADDHTVHPVLLDAPLQATIALADEQTPREAAGYLPSVFGSVRVWRTPAPSGVVYLRRRSRSTNEICWDITYADTDGTVTAEIDGCRTRRAHLSDRPPLTVQRTVLRAAPHPALPPPPSPLPAPAEVTAAAQATLAAARSALDGCGHDRFTAAAEAAVAHCWAAALRSLLAAPATPFRTADLEAGGLQPKHRRLVRLMLPLLVRHSLIRAAGDRWQLTDTALLPDALLRSLVEDHPAFGPDTLLLNRHLRHLPEMLRGTTDPRDLLLAGESFAEQRQETAPAHRFTQRAVQALLARIVHCWPSDRPLRVLEVGATTTALTAAVLPLLPADRTRYTCTAASQAAFARARHRFALLDFVDYRPLDLDADPAAQGLPEACFDLIVAGDALHAVTDLAAALGRLRALLVPGGHLLATEPHNAPVEGLLRGGLESFWERSDRTLRPATRLLPADRWKPLLERYGFTGTVQIGPRERSVLLTSADRRPVDEPALPAPPADTTWLIATEAATETSTAQALSALLGPCTVMLAPTDTATWAAALPDHGEVRIVLLLAETRPPQVGTRTIRRAAVLRALATASEALRAGIRPQVWLVTRPTGLFPAPERPAHPEDAAIWAAARTLSNERPDLCVRRVSFDRTGDVAADAWRLAAELLAPANTTEHGGERGKEDEIVLTRRGRFVPRQVQYPADEAPTAPATTPFILEARDPGLARRLVWRQMSTPQPGPGEVAVEMRAVALNYRDAMRANGLLPPEAVEDSPLSRGLGNDGAGVVRAVGPGVRDIAIGDRVHGVVPAALASHAVIPADGAMRIPDTMSFEEAATFPVVFLTVHHTLLTQAHVDAGETVLVHGGAGAVGLAVLQCARARGARVIATAGTETKRDLLRTLGAEHVLDSRTLHFAAQVRELTGGHGVDIVVNSLSGEAMTQSLDLLRPNGRFIELGKRDIFLNNPLPLRAFDRSLAFIGFNLDSVVLDRTRGARLAADLTEQVDRGGYRPLPHTVYPAARVEEAFQLLQHSRHTGKVVVSFDPLDEPVLVEPAPATTVLDGTATYLVTGGLTGLGAATAHWLADHGARHLALVSRRGPAAPEAAALLTSLTGRGVHATAYAADVADEADLHQVLGAVDASGQRLRGVVHAATHMDDAPLAELTDDRFAAVLAPKATGAALLDRATAGRDLDMFLTYSSVAAGIGNLGQAAYAAANAYLEALTRARRAAGRPATTLAYGPIGDTGYAARHHMGAAMAERGFEPLTTAEALAVAGRSLGLETDVAGIGRYRWGHARRLLSILSTPRFAHLVPAGASSSPQTRDDLLRELAAMAPDEAMSVITQTLARFLAAVLHTDAAELDPARPVTDYGLDSLLSTEFLVRAREHFDIRITPPELMAGGRTLTHFARLVHSRLGIDSASDT
ncbi:SDR family NAD(P)-dependent oxidoreductase [Streptomyces sp. ACA25]|uniref:type I polyketide synthase n=1 Tax=Streptomyces sp. ACA25 TaxID=3022596 RepID=UPI0023075920|nr:type I polyketide synthase [Streptomyces sp. ACA25]MDB1090270.1 SDR family NAD(P)-dependent oxidoreductase [Streptomyces sp. ACA25]